MSATATPASIVPVSGAAATIPLIHPILEKIADYLRARPDLAAIDPADITPDLLPYLFVLSIEPDGAARRLRIRLTGTALDTALGRCVCGKYLEDFLHGTHSAAVLAGFHACAETGEPIWMRQVVSITNRAPRYVEGIAYRIGEARIYGGLLFGEVSNHETAESFESHRL